MLRSSLALIALLTVGLVGCERTADVATATETEAAEVDVDVESDTVAAAAAAAPAGEAPAGEEGSCGGSCGGNCEEGGSCGCGAAMADRPPRQVPPDAIWHTFDVQMRCGGCAKKIEAALAGVEGVYDVSADPETDRVRVATAPTTRDARKSIVPRIESLGYSVR